MPRAAPPVDVFADVAAPCRSLARRSVPLRRALKTIDAPHIRRRPGGFGGLFRIIVEQQVSVPSAQAILKRINATVDSRDPQAVLRLGAEGLAALGLSRPKARYVCDIAALECAGTLHLGALAAQSDADAQAALTALRGVGPWTASIYLLFCEGRVDIWPPRDVALKAAYNTAAQHASAATPEMDQASLDELADDWAPYRGLAAHILWTYYAHLRGRAPI